MGFRRGLGSEQIKLSFRLMNIVKSKIDAVRQDFREQVPDNLAKAFTRKLKKHEWSRLHRLAQIDLLALGKAAALALLKDPSTLGKSIADAEELVSSLGGKRGTVYRDKAKALATYIANRDIISNSLQANAYAIARLAGEDNLAASAVSEALVQAIDKLTTLYAYDMLDEPTKTTATELAQTEDVGMRTLTGFLGETRQSELNRMLAAASGTNAEVSRLNGRKGYVPANAQDGTSIKIADDSETADLLKKGFKKIGVYVGDPNASYNGSRSYFQSSVATRNAFRQGVAQTVHSTWQGVDVRTGLSQTQETSGMVFGVAAKTEIHSFELYKGLGHL